MGAKAPKTDQNLVGVTNTVMETNLHSLDKRRSEMERSQVMMKGVPSSVYAQGKCVVVWVKSPTGDSSDSFIYNIPCLSDEQAITIAKTWRSVWALPEY
ncbi:MAG: hypothetical protein EBX50_16975 [Chitinophagia bacterium]|nr:hypothetical protein [Chitinophagia bacterium]